MTDEEMLALNEISILLGSIRKVCEEAAVIKTKYRGLENRPYPKKNDPVGEKNRATMKKILGELDIIQDTSTLSRVKIKNLCKELDPVVVLY